MNRIRALVREAPESSLPVPPCEVTAGNWQPTTQKRPSPKPDHADSLTLAFPASRTGGDKFRLFINHGVCGILLWQPEETKTAPRLGDRNNSPSRRPPLLLGFLTRSSHNSVCLLHTLSLCHILLHADTLCWSPQNPCRIKSTRTGARVVAQCMCRTSTGSGVREA